MKKLGPNYIIIGILLFFGTYEYAFACSPCAPYRQSYLEGNASILTESFYLTLALFIIGIFILTASIFSLIKKKFARTLFYTNIIFIIINFVLIIFNLTSFAQYFDECPPCPEPPINLHYWEFPWLLIYLKGYWNIALGIINLIVLILSIRNQKKTVSQTTSQFNQTPQ